jgi:hypothetical protein
VERRSEIPFVCARIHFTADLLVRTGSLGASSDIC